MADERHTHCGERSPFRVMADRGHYGRSDFFLRENLQDLRFGEARVIECGRDDFSMAFDEKSAHDACGSLASERDFFAEGKLRKARDEGLLSDGAQIGRRRGRESQAHEVHGVEFANQA